MALYRDSTPFPHSRMRTAKLACCGSLVVQPCLHTGSCPCSVRWCTSPSAKPGSLTDSSVDTASDSEKVLLPGLTEAFQFPERRRGDLAVTSCCLWHRLGWGCPHDRRPWTEASCGHGGVVTPVLRLWVGHKGSHCSCERYTFLALGGSPSSRRCSGTRT